MKRSRIIMLTFMCLSTSLLCSCGIRPKNVAPPTDVEHDTFPGVYPDDSIDPFNINNNKR